MPAQAIEMIDRMYADFNARHIDAVLATMADDVEWANGMDGGYVHGREAVRDYWTRQWSMVSPHVEPVTFVPEGDGVIAVAFGDEGDGVIAVEVTQTVFDLDGKPLQGQDHGLKDKTVWHIFQLANGKIARFDIKES